MQKAITVLNTKRFSGNPADGIDNFNRAVFGKMHQEECIFSSIQDESQSGNNANFEVGSIKKIKSILKELIFGGYDIMWGNGHAREVFYWIIKPRATSYIINFHTILIKKNGPWKTKTPWFVRWLIFRCADGIICPSEFSAESVRRYFPNKKVINILNGVDLLLFNPNKRNDQYLKETFNIDTGRRRVVFIGTLQPRKRPNIFLEVAQQIPEFDFILVGAATPPWTYTHTAQNIKNVRYISRMSRDEVAILLASSDIFLFPSLNEPSAAVILEAMASGCVPIVSKSGGNGEFFEHNRGGILVEPEKEEIGFIVRTIKELYVNIERMNEMKENAYKSAQEHSWNMAAKKYQEAIQNIKK